MLVPKARLVIENLALRQKLAVFKHHCKRPKLHRATVSSGSGFLVAGPTGDRCLPLSSQKQSSDGIAKDSSCIGVGSPKAESRDGRPFRVKSVS